MQPFIPSVLSALEVLLKGPIWLLRKVISIFFSREPPPPPIQPVASKSYSLSDSPYVESAHSQPQRPTYHSYPPPRPTAQYSQSPSQHTPSQPPSRRQQSVRLPTQPTRPVSPDVAPVAEPVQSQIPQRSRRRSGPELPTRAPEVVVKPVEIDPYEDIDSLRHKARNEGDRMEECFKQSREAFTRNERGLAKQLSLRGEAYKNNMERLDKEASTRIFQEHNQRHAGSNTIDLHGQFVSEAKQHFSDAVQRVRDHGIFSSLYVIVGKGNRSENNIARIKPAIQEYATSLGLGVEVDPLNDGCLVVSLDSDDD